MVLLVLIVMAASRAVPMPPVTPTVPVESLEALVGIGGGGEGPEQPAPAVMAPDGDLTGVDEMAARLGLQLCSVEFGEGRGSNHTTGRESGQVGTIRVMPTKKCRV